MRWFFIISLKKTALSGPEFGGSVSFVFVLSSHPGAPLHCHKHKRLKINLFTLSPHIR